MIPSMLVARQRHICSEGPEMIWLASTQWTSIRQDYLGSPVSTGIVHVEKHERNFGSSLVLFLQVDFLQGCLQV